MIRKSIVFCFLFVSVCVTLRVWSPPAGSGYAERKQQQRHRHAPPPGFDPVNRISLPTSIRPPLRSYSCFTRRPTTIYRVSRIYNTRFPFLSCSTSCFPFFHWRPYTRAYFLLLFLPQTDRNLTSIHLGRQIIIPPDHLARIDQVRVPPGRHPLALIRGPTGLIDRSVEKGLRPFFLGRRVRRRRGLFGQTRLFERGSLGGGRRSDPGEVGRVTGLDDVVGDDAGVLQGDSRSVSHHVLVCDSFIAASRNSRVQQVPHPPSSSNRSCTKAKPTHRP